MLEDLLHAWGKKDVERYLGALKQAAAMATQAQVPGAVPQVSALEMGPEAAPPPMQEEVPA
jgi:hypothetical protein